MSQNGQTTMNVVLHVYVGMNKSTIHAATAGKQTDLYDPF